MASANFTNLTLHLAQSYFNSKTFKVMLLSSVPSEANLDSWVNRSDVTTEVTGTGYTAGGATVTATVGSIDTTNNRVSVTFSNPSWTNATITALAAIVYVSSGSAATDELVAMLDFGGTKGVTNGTFPVTFNTPFYINR
jgi:hypothetical protein